MFFDEQIVIYLIFLLAIIANLIAEIKDSNIARYYTKPLLVPMLLVFYLIMSRVTNHFIVAALIFYFIGDCFLLIPYNNSAFRLGGLSFFIGHLFWSVCIFFQIDFSIIHPAVLWWYFIPGIAPTIFAITILWKYLYKIRILAILYALSISALLYFCLLRYGQVSTYKFWIALGGIGSFIVSDFTLVKTRFKNDFKYSGLLIFITYVLAIVLLLIGIMDPVIESQLGA